jgi:hypothetical protein
LLALPEAFHDMSLSSLAPEGPRNVATSEAQRNSWIRDRLRSLAPAGAKDALLVENMVHDRCSHRPCRGGTVVCISIHGFRSPPEGRSPPVATFRRSFGAIGCFDSARTIRTRAITALLPFHTIFFWPWRTRHWTLCGRPSQVTSPLRAPKPTLIHR